MKASVVRNTAVKAMLVSIFVAASPAAFAQVNYGDFAGAGVLFQDVTETAQPPDPAVLWYAPTIVGPEPTLLFFPAAFVSSCAEGSSDITASQLTTTITAQGGNTLGTIELTENGDVALMKFPPFGDPTTNASVNISGFLTVTEDTGGVIAPVVIPIAGVSVPTVSFSLPGDFGVSTWTGSVTVDVANVVPNATKADLVFDNSLETNCGADNTGGRIQKKVIQITVVIGEPDV